MKNIITAVLLFAATAASQWRPYTCEEIRAKRAYGNLILQQSLRNPCRPRLCRPVYQPAFIAPQFN